MKGAWVFHMSVPCQAVECLGLWCLTNVAASGRQGGEGSGSGRVGLRVSGTQFQLGDSVQVWAA